jgi:hypothetical protein
LKKITRSLRQHRELILNYFRAGKLISSGVVAGLDNKAFVESQSLSWGAFMTRFDSDILNWPAKERQHHVE